MCDFFVRPTTERGEAFGKRASMCIPSLRLGKVMFCQDVRWLGSLWKKEMHEISSVDHKRLENCVVQRTNRKETRQQSEGGGASHLDFVEKVVCG